MDTHVTAPPTAQDAELARVLGTDHRTSLLRKYVWPLVATSLVALAVVGYVAAALRREERSPAVSVAEARASLAGLQHVAELSGRKVPSKTELETADASLKRTIANARGLRIADEGGRDLVSHAARRQQRRSELETRHDRDGRDYNRDARERAARAKCRAAVFSAAAR